ncbi:MAG: ABC transporter permease [Vulcanimicrobiaceae bacterium]
MEPSRIAAVFMRHAYEFRHNVNQMANMLYLPIMNIVLWGFFTVYLRQGEQLRPSIVSCLLGAIILWGLFNTFQREIATGFLEEVWSQNLVNLFGSPLTISEYAAGLVAANLVKVFAGFLAGSLVAWAFYHYDIFPALMAFMPFLLNLALFALAVGIVITGLILRYTTKIQAMAWSFAGLLMPLSCVLYPLTSLPGVLRPLAWMLPTTQSFEGMREAINAGTFSAPDFTWGFALNLAYVAFSVVFFRSMFESARSRGLLVKTA